VADNNRPSPAQDAAAGGAASVRASILHQHPESASRLRSEEPEFFRDLNLEQVVGSITVGRQEYDLAPFFYSPLRTTEAVRYRHEALRDLERAEVRSAVDEFAARMRTMRRHLKLAEEFRYRHEKERLFLDGAGIYCEAIERLGSALDSVDLNSRALQDMRDHLARYGRSEGFRSLVAETRRLQGELAALTYSIQIDGRSSRRARSARSTRTVSVLVNTAGRHEASTVLPPILDRLPRDLRNGWSPPAPRWLGNVYRPDAG
jgi:hypothetical protein